MLKQNPHCRRLEQPPAAFNKPSKNSSMTLPNWLEPWRPADVIRAAVRTAAAQRGLRRWTANRHLQQALPCARKSGSLAQPVGPLEASALQESNICPNSPLALPASNRLSEEIRKLPRLDGAVGLDQLILFDGGSSVLLPNSSRSESSNASEGRSASGWQIPASRAVANPQRTLMQFRSGRSKVAEAQNQKLTGRSYAVESPVTSLGDQT